MTGRILVVDDLPPNVKLLEAKLTGEYYEVYSTLSAKEGIRIAKDKSPDIILLDVMMPEMDGFEACRRLKQDPVTAHIPVVMVTALSDIQDRVQGLDAGADDFITKPINDVHLFARVKSLIRLKVMQDELRMRDKTGTEFGLANPTDATRDIKATIMLIDDDVVEAKNISEHLKKMGHTVHSIHVPEMNQCIDQHDFDLIIVSTQLTEIDGLRLCSQIRSKEKSRHVPLLILVDNDERDLLIKGLEMGINDYIITPLDGNELTARVRTQIKRKRYQDLLRQNYKESLNLAVIDSLTKLYNRRYLDAHLKNMVQESLQKKSDLSVMSLDIDHFKQVNDGPGLGHHIGDEVLQQVAERIVHSTRNTDLSTRPGGEEFTVIMPNTSLKQATDVAERIRLSVANYPFRISAGEGKLSVTISIGITEINKAGDTAENILKRADAALYEAKRQGRNRVINYPASV